MQLFKLKTRLSEFNSFADFAKEFNLKKEDLIIRMNSYTIHTCVIFTFLVVLSCRNTTEWGSRLTR